MTPAARIQAAIEILDLVIEAAARNGASADRIIAEWFRQRRFAGSKDRRAIRELVYRVIRTCGERPESGRAAMLCLAREDETIAALFDGSIYGPAPIEDDEPIAESGIAPRWLLKRLAESGIEGAEAAALLDRAPLDVRVNTLKAERDALALPLEGEGTATPHAIRFPSGTPVEQWEAWREGLIEVQDSGSQIACMAVGARPGETVIDLCAGAGGKTLSLAAAMENRGALIACDTDRGRLQRLEPRALRAGATLVQSVLLDPGREAEALAQWSAAADAVLVDAPCSGTGTWRRNPETRWRLDERTLASLVQLQARLLGVAAALVRPGGRLVYVTCSLLDDEGAGQVDAFLNQNSGWRARVPILPAGSPRGKGLRLTPARDGTDGFFVAELLRL